jgi:hypothetical protein
MAAVFISLPLFLFYISNLLSDPLFSPVTQFFIIIDDHYAYYTYLEKDS